MHKVYLASSFTHAEWLRTHIVPPVLRAGFTICSTWHQNAKGPERLEHMPLGAIRAIAAQNDHELRLADVVTARSCRSTPTTKTHLGESPLSKAEAHRLAHKLRDPKFYTARTKRAVNSGGLS
jgi:hypothetical protein